MARFYCVAVVPTLFGNWAVVREWGQIGQGGTVREEAFDVEADAVRTADEHIIRKRRGGYALADAREGSRSELAKMSGASQM